MRVLEAGWRGFGQRLYRFSDAQAYGLQPKKRSVGATERDEFLRAAWRALVAGRIGAKRLVFVDECSTNISLRPHYAWSHRGERARFRTPRNWGPNVTLLASMTPSGMGPSLAVEGATTRAVFEAYVEKALVPSMHSGQAVVMDDLSAHKGARIRRLIEERAASSSTCHPTRQISTPSSKPSRSSRGYFAEPRPAPARP